MSLRSNLLSIENINLISNIVVKKIKELTGININPNDTFLASNIGMISMSVVNSESHHPNTRKSLLYVNSIIISETVKFILDNIKDPDEPEEVQHTSISDLPDDPIPLNQDDGETQVVSVAPQPAIPELKPIFKNEQLIINSYDFNKESEGEYFYNLNMNCLKASLNLFVFDNSDYIITEFTNELMVNQQTVSIPPGNYSPESLVLILNKSINESNVSFSFDKTIDCFTIAYLKKQANTVKDLKTIPSVNIDFCMRNSIHKKLGFEMRTYQINQGESVSGCKHALTAPQWVSLSVGFSDKVSHNYTIPLDVEYNSTKFYKDQYNSQIDLGDIDIRKVSISLKTPDGKPYNTRGRDFSLHLNIQTI
jgi:hypothetical protein